MAYTSLQYLGRSLLLVSQYVGCIDVKAAHVISVKASPDSFIGADGVECVGQWELQILTPSQFCDPTSAILSTDQHAFWSLPCLPRPI